MKTETHKLITHGKGETLWGECSCGIWCRLLTYHMPKGRLATLRTEHAKHKAEARAEAQDQVPSLPPHFPY
jgi:hypothetical protein